MGVLGFFFVVAVTLELYFLALRPRSARRAPTQLFARLFAVDGAADPRTRSGSPLALAPNHQRAPDAAAPCAVSSTIVRRRPYWWPLQLGIAPILALSVVLDFSVGIDLRIRRNGEPTGGALALFYGANLPWLLAYGLLAVDAGVTIAHELRGAELEGVAAPPPKLFSYTKSTFPPPPPVAAPSLISGLQHTRTR